ncbi:MurR/RpiR family transcriptional regulator [Gellertiella hungarica]|uniref:DNA-binding MurR/RpiR family transcriptional regulator n=1 Tax=Gellertiella hungarica TaxID=1572859 RepID=A0A7W6J6M7_9HYPH|nr:MurR/RpiR family transcriptional regulator [Gellertiella hungarica]MBB4065776.1 DNA-binding MurR/RpiR family transcriptional regulator [Gellertiella hungarica]
MTERLPSQPDLQRMLNESLTGATRTERAIASYMLNNLTGLPFETAASIAAKIGVSEASISRYCKALGLRHFRALKDLLRSDLGDRAWLIGDRLRDFHARSASAGKVEKAKALEREIAAIVAVYELAETADFARAVDRLAHAPKVFVAGFQTERHHGYDLAHNLQYLRDGVQVADLAAGHFAEVLLSDPAETCLVLIDGRRYSRLTWRLAVEARDAGIPVTLITDPYCDWGRELASELLTVQTNLNRFWDTTSAMSCLISLMVNAVFTALGADVEERMTRVSSLYHKMIGHAGDRSGPDR